MRNKLLLTGAVVASLGAAAPAMAAEPFGEGFGELSANVAFTNNYVFRGITQSDEQFALQGGFDYSHDLGIYLGIWGSSIDFNDGDEGELEVDFYGGWAGSYNDIGIDLGVIYYWYPGADDALDYDYVELAGSLSYDFDMFSVAAGLNYSPNYFANSDTFWYPHASIEFGLPYEFTLGASIGHNDIDDEASFGVEDYTDYSISLGYEFYGFDLSLAWIDTDLDEPTECADGCEDHIVFTVARSF